MTSRVDTRPQGRRAQQAAHLAMSRHVGGSSARRQGWLVDGLQRTYFLAMAPSPSVAARLASADELPLVSANGDEHVLTRPAWTQWIAQCGAVAQDLTTCPSTREARNKAYILNMLAERRHPS